MPLYAQFARPADQHAASILSGQLGELRKRERLRKLFEQQAPEDVQSDLAATAELLAPIVGLDLLVTLGYLAEFKRELGMTTAYGGGLVAGCAGHARQVAVEGDDRFSQPRHGCKPAD